MAASMSLTKDLKEIVKAVTKKTPNMVFNDKRKTFKRRYKFAGVYDVTKKQMAEIKSQIEKKYPDNTFELESVRKRSLKKVYWSYRYYTGLKIRVF